MQVPCHVLFLFVCLSFIPSLCFFCYYIRDRDGGRNRKFCNTTLHKVEPVPYCELYEETTPLQDVQ